VWARAAWAALGLKFFLGLIAFSGDLHCATADILLSIAQPKSSESIFPEHVQVFDFPKK
jgi:hypothetical protein